MKIFVAGATGVLGRELVPQLVARGHEVVGMTRSGSKQDLVRSLGARPVVVDALDADAVAEAVASVEPEVIVHELTALSGKMRIRDARHPDRSPMAKMTNRLRTEATDHLSAAGRAVGARRFVAQSFGAFRWARTGGPVQTEADPLDPDPPAPLRPVVEGLLYLEEAVTTIGWGEGLALRSARGAVPPDRSILRRCRDDRGLGVGSGASRRSRQGGAAQRLPTQGRLGRNRASGRSARWRVSAGRRGARAPTDRSGLRANHLRRARARRWRRALLDDVHVRRRGAERSPFLLV